MKYVPSIALLEATHQFPGPYMFKAIGQCEEGFAARVVAAVRDELDQEVDPPFKVRQTASGRHIAVTVEPRIQAAHQVLAVYRRIRDMRGLIMVW
jgi:uncharacterized protein